MIEKFHRAGIAAALTLGAMTVTPSAEAQSRYYHHRGHGDATGAAIAGGVIGLALGAAIASSGHRDYYDDGYYYGRPRGYYYGYPRTYYYRSYPRYYYYDRYPRHYYRGGGWNGWRGNGWHGGHGRHNGW